MSKCVFSGSPDVAAASDADSYHSRVVFCDVETYGKYNHVCGDRSNREYNANAADWKAHLWTVSDPPIAIGHDTRATMVVIHTTERGWEKFPVEKALMAAVDAAQKVEGRNRADTAKEFLDNPSLHPIPERQAMVVDLTQKIMQAGVVVCYKGGNGTSRSLDVRFLSKLLGIPEKELMDRMVDPWYMFKESLQDAAIGMGLNGKSARGGDAPYMAAKEQYDSLWRYCMIDVHLMMLCIKLTTESDSSKWEMLAQAHKNGTNKVALVKECIKKFEIVRCNDYYCGMPLIKPEELKMKHHKDCLLAVCFGCTRTLTQEESLHEQPNLTVLCGHCECERKSKAIAQGGH